MSKCEWYVVSVRKTMCGAVKIRKRKVDRRPSCMCYCIGDWLIKALPYIAIMVIGSVVGCQLTHSPDSKNAKSILEVKSGTNVVFSITQEIR